MHVASLWGNAARCLDDHGARAVGARCVGAVQETQALVELAGVKCLLMPGDIGGSAFCNKLVEATVKVLTQ